MLIRFDLPFHGTTYLQVVTNEPAASGPRSVVNFSASELVCLKQQELYRLALPNPRYPATFATSHWARYASTLVSGPDIRASLPTLRLSPLLLAVHLDYLVQQLRVHVILTHFTSGDYVKLFESLELHRLLLYHTAVLARGEWRVSPATVTSLFRDVYSLHGRLLTNCDEASDLTQPLKQGHGSTGHLHKRALRVSWLFEEFLRLIRSACQ